MKPLMRPVVAVAVLALAGAFCGSPAAEAASRSTGAPVAWRADSETQASYGDPEDGDRFNLFCTAGNIEATFPDALMAEAAGPRTLSIEGLGAKQEAPFTLPEGEDGWLSVRAAPEGLILTTLLSGQPLTFRRAGHVYSVPAAQAPGVVRSLVVRCLTGRAPKAAPNADEADLMKRNDQAAAQCLHGPQTAQATRAACATRDATRLKLGDAGWCFGRDAEFGKAYRWHRCVAD